MCKSIKIYIIYIIKYLCPSYHLQIEINMLKMVLNGTYCHRFLQEDVVLHFGKSHSWILLIYKYSNMCNSLW